MFTRALRYFLIISGVYNRSVLHQKLKNDGNMAQGSVWGKVTQVKTELDIKSSSHFMDEM